MKLLDVYSKYNIDLIKAKGARLTNSEGKEHLDFNPQSKI